MRTRDFFRLVTIPALLAVLVLATAPVSRSDCDPPSSAPTLFSPSDGSASCDTTPGFDWSSVAEALAYRIQVDDGLRFLSPEIDEVVTSSSYGAGITLSGAYKWRVRALNVCGNGPWSEVWSFTVPLPLSAPALEYPVNGWETVDTTPSFGWSDVTWATAYVLQVDTKSDFTSFGISHWADSSEYTPHLAWYAHIALTHLGH